MTSQPPYSVLVIDDDTSDIRKLTAGLTGYRLSYAHTVDRGLELLSSEAPDVVLLDYSFKKGPSGIEGLREIKATTPSTIVVFVTKYFDRRLIAEAQRLGADECISKQTGAEQLRRQIERAIWRNIVWREYSVLKEESDRHQITPVFESRAMRAVHDYLERIKESRQAVLITGAPGTGKNVLARWLHRMSARAGAPCLNLYIPELTDESFDERLFGRRATAEGGVYEGSGLFDRARGGTVILDEIGELSPHQQARLLRVLREGTFTPVGDVRNISHNVRIVALTSRDLEKAVARRLMREDLYAELSTLHAEVPPLNDRLDDLPELVVQIMDSIRSEEHTSVTGVSDALVDHLLSLDWVGNVRELERKLRLAALMCDREILDIPQWRGTFAEDKRRSGPGAQSVHELLRRRWKDAETGFNELYFRHTMKVAGGVVAEAARRAGVDKRTIYNWRDRFGPS